MQNKPLQIFKTPTAEKKIKEIIIFSARKWGKESAKKYALELEKSIISVAEGKIKTKINKKFSTRFCYCRAKKHYIFFEILEDKLIVVALFHVAMDVKNLFDDKVF